MRRSAGSTVCPSLYCPTLSGQLFANINASERIFWRNTMLPELGFLEEQLNRMLLPRFGYPDLEVMFDVSSIEAPREDDNSHVSREAQLLDRGVLTINEVRRSRSLPGVPWGDTWAKAPPAARQAVLPEEPKVRSQPLPTPNDVNGASLYH